MLLIWVIYFMDVKSLISIDLSNFNNGKLNKMNRMFSGCEKLKHIILNNFNTQNVTKWVIYFMDVNL